MKNQIILFFCLVSLALAGCNANMNVNNEREEVSMLSKEQVEKLVPYMIDLKKESDMVSTMDSIMTSDSTILKQYRNMQSYTFRILVNENNYPVMPDSSSTSARRNDGGGMRTGGFSTLCMGGCMQPAREFPCLTSGCKPLDNACGCTPQNCGTCQELSCTTHVLGMISGGFSMR